MRPKINEVFNVRVSDDRGNHAQIKDSDHLVLWSLGRTGIKIEVTTPDKSILTAPA